MSLVQLRASLALWRKRHAWRQRRLDIAHQVNSKPRIVHWEKRRREAATKIHALVKQVAAASKQSYRAKAISYAKSFVGVRETVRNGGGQIDVWQRRLGFGHVPWCGVFVGNMLLHAGVKGVSSRIASVGAIEDDAKARRGCFRGWTTNPANAQRGDLVVLGGYGVHTGLVASVDTRRGVVHTVEGNASNGVRAVARPFWSVRGIAQVNYPN